MNRFLAAIALILLLSSTAPSFGALEIIMDNRIATFSGTWTAEATGTNKYGTEYRFATISTSNGSTATYTPSIPVTMTDWAVYAWYPTISGGTATTSAQYVIHHALGDTTVTKDQTVNRGTWVLLGTYTMNAGTGNYCRITNQGSQTTKKVVADAIRFYSATGVDLVAPVISNVSATPSSTSVVITWTTDEPATSQVEYGATPSYGSLTTEDVSQFTSHSVTITGLSPSTLYNFRVKSKDSANNLTNSTNYTFTTTAAQPEIRAAWADTWHDGILSASQITTMVDTLSQAKYNVVIPEIRKAGDAYYNSAYEPRATNIIDPLPFDPLQDLIDKAHAAGVEVHGWLVAYRIWSSGFGTPPPSHVWAQHPEWAMKTYSGGISDGGNYNLDPGVPAVQDYICKVAVDVVSNYDVDGLNWDYIRYPGYDWGYNEITEQRFYNEYKFWPPQWDPINSPADPQWQTWAEYRRQQVTDLVRKVYLEILAIKPWVKHSVDTVSWMGADPNTNYTDTRQYKEVMQNAKGWLEQHLIDIDIQMNYKRDYDYAQMSDFRVWTNFAASQAALNNRHATVGSGVYLNSIADSVTQMAYSRAAGTQGECSYSYAVTNYYGAPNSDFWNAVRTNLFTTTVLTPDMPWKSSPTTGIIFGTVTDASLPNDPIYQNWVYKAHVVVNGPANRDTYTDATGTFGFMDLPPGTYSITVSKSGFADRTYYNQVLLAGDVLRQDFDLGTVTSTSPSEAVHAEWALVSVPSDPVNSDPVSVFAGIDIDTNLYRYDRPTQSMIMYDAWTSDVFGNVSTDDGYWLRVPTNKIVSYQARAGYPTTHMHEFPYAGWGIIGCAFPTQRQWADAGVMHAGQNRTLQAAAYTEGWLTSIGYGYDSTTQSMYDIGIPDDFPTRTVIEPWQAYWVRTLVNDVKIITR